MVALLGCNSDRVESNYKHVKPSLVVALPPIIISESVSRLPELDLPHGKPFELRGTVSGVDKLAGRSPFVGVWLHPVNAREPILGSALATTKYIGLDKMEFSCEFQAFQTKREMEMEIDLESNHRIVIPVRVE